MSFSKKEFHTDVPLPEFDRTIPQKNFPSETISSKKSDRIRKGTESAVPINQEDLDIKKQKEFQGLDAKQTLLKRKELDLDNPHQLERHSCTGIPAYLKKEKRGGGGVHNWGTNSVKEDFERPINYDVEEQLEREEEADILPVSENAVTFDEYIEKSGKAEIHQKVNELKEKITEEQLIKEIGKATPVKSEEVDDRKEHPQTKVPGENYHMSMQTLNADLLGFKVESTVEEPKEETTKEKAGEPTKNPIKKAFDFVGEKLGLKPPSSQTVKGVFLEDDKAFPKLD
mmetsp:Transcript_72312/g.84008  ORF Transcript_72312/g.84008 Transcript_72312/m.84008 type:complete len:285 (+) Transcript_72312:19-873(+)